MQCRPLPWTLLRVRSQICLTHLAWGCETIFWALIPSVIYFQFPHRKGYKRGNQASLNLLARVIHHFDWHVRQVCDSTISQSPYKHDILSRNWNRQLARVVLFGCSTNFSELALKICRNQLLAEMIYRLRLKIKNRLIISFYDRHKWRQTKNCFDFEKHSPNWWY